MSNSPDPLLSALLYEALGEPIGLLCLATPDFERGRAKLYQTRAKLADPELEILQFRASPFPEEGNLIIVKETVQVSQSNDS